MTPEQYQFKHYELEYWRREYRNLSYAALDFIHNDGAIPYGYTRGIAHISNRIAQTKRSLNMARTMYDSTTPDNIPTSADIVAYYPHAWGTDISTHEHAIVVSIDNTGAHADDCHILDVESGAATNTIAAEWVASWHKLHPSGLACVNGHIQKPVLYTSTSNLPSLRQATAGMAYDTWAAQWDGTQTPVPGCFAKQYIDHGPNGENYDMSVVFDDTWGLVPSTPTPTPTPQPHATFNPTEGMVFWTDPQWSAHARLVTSTDGGLTWH